MLTRIVACLSLASLVLGIGGCSSDPGAATASGGPDLKGKPTLPPPTASGGGGPSQPAAVAGNSGPQ
jgi:hypothetical protein